MDDASRVKLIMNFDIRTDRVDRYYQFMLGEFVPTAQTLGIQMNGAWHTAYGDYPMRLVEFIADDAQTMRIAIASSTWERLEGQLQAYVANYTRKTVRLREDIFQF